MTLQKRKVIEGMSPRKQSSNHETHNGSVPEDEHGKCGFKSPLRKFSYDYFNPPTRIVIQDFPDFKGSFVLYAK